MAQFGFKLPNLLQAKVATADQTGPRPGPGPCPVPAQAVHTHPPVVPGLSQMQKKAPGQNPLCSTGDSINPCRAKASFGSSSLRGQKLPHPNHLTGPHIATLGSPEDFLGDEEEVDEGHAGNGNYEDEVHAGDGDYEDEPCAGDTNYQDEDEAKRSDEEGQGNVHGDLDPEDMDGMYMGPFADQEEVSLLSSPCSTC
jgi:hypothetical protein